MSKIVELKSGHLTATILGGTRVVLVALVASMGLTACGGSNDDSVTDNQNPTTTAIEGNAQKGPFQAGGTAGAFQLQADGSLGGGSVSGDITSNGSFSLTDADWAGPAQLEMTGVFFNEITSNFTSNSAALHAVITLPDEANANVNLFTHFIAARTRNLMGTGDDFSNARTLARSELAAIIGISAAPTSLDLLQDNGSSSHQNDSANLLLFSAATLTADVDQAGIDAIAADFADDGLINGAGDTELNKIKQAAKGDPDLLTDARIRMLNWYSVALPERIVDLSPIWVPVAPQKVAASNSTDGDSFGVSVAMDGDTAVIGAEFAEIGSYGDAGSAYVFTRVNGVWSESQQLIASDTSSIDFFGSSVALDGDTIVVGARNADGGGAAYVFIRSNDGWSEQAKLVASDRVPGASFGSAVAIEGNTALVGARGYYKNGDGLQGAAYTFTRSGSSWSQQAKLTAIGGSEPEIAKFGFAVALQGDTALIGAPFTRITERNAEGAVHVFNRSGDSWNHVQKLSAGPGEGTVLFGYSVSISGETAVVGQSQGTVGTNTAQGSAYVYDRVGGVWSERQRLTANDGESRDIFGSSVSILDDTILIGAGFADAYARLSGVAYVFTRSGDTWSQQEKLWAKPASQDDRFGYAVVLDGTTGLIGAYTSGTSYIDPGKAYFYDLSYLISP